MTLKYLIFMCNFTASKCLGVDDIPICANFHSHNTFSDTCYIMLSRIARRKGRAMGDTLWIAWVAIPVVRVIVGACSFMVTGRSIPSSGNKRETKEGKQMKWLIPQQLAFPITMYL